MYFQLNSTGDHCLTQMTGQLEAHVTSLNVLDHVLSQLLPIGAVRTVPDPVPRLVATTEQLGLHCFVKL
jgi:hypothetical protein